MLHFYPNLKYTTNKWRKKHFMSILAGSDARILHKNLVVNISLDAQISNSSSGNSSQPQREAHIKQKNTKQKGKMQNKRLRHNLG